MRQRGNCSCFAGEPGAHLRIRRDGAGKNLDGDAAIQTRVVCAEHVSHAADTESAFDAVGPELGARTKIRTIMEQRSRRHPNRPI
jgi:hypothetical protein